MSKEYCEHRFLPSYQGRRKNESGKTIVVFIAFRSLTRFFEAIENNGINPELAVELLSSNGVFAFFTSSGGTINKHGSIVPSNNRCGGGADTKSYPTLIAANGCKVDRLNWFSTVSGMKWIGLKACSTNPEVTKSNKP